MHSLDKKIIILTVLLSIYCLGCDEDNNRDAGHIPFDSTGATSDDRIDAGADVEIISTHDAGAFIIDAGPDTNIIDLNDSGVDSGVNFSNDAGDIGTSVIKNLTVIYRTSDALNAGTIDAPKICFSEDECHTVSTPGVRDNALTKRGEVAVFELENVNINREDLEFVQIKGNFNAWKPSCVALRFDGEPAYCNDQLDVNIRTRGYIDPDGFTQNCLTCEESVIPQGPIQGAHGQNHLQFWVRFDASRPFQVRLGQNPSLSDGTIVYANTPDVEKDYIEHIKVENLLVNTQYYYRIEVTPAASEGHINSLDSLNTPIYKAKTLPLNTSTEGLKIAIGSCANKDEQLIYRSMSRRDPNLYLFLGDTHYANSSHKEAHSWYLNKARREKNVKKLMANTPTLTIWDDHDFLGNNSNGMCEGVDEVTANFKDQWSNPDLGLQRGTYFSYSYGKMDFFMLDCRSFRPEIGDFQQVCRIDDNADMLIRDEGMLGLVQENWLVDSLKESTATFKFIACGSQWRRDGTSDSWKKFPIALNRLIEKISAESIEGLVMLDGDVHRSEFNVFKRAGDYNIPIITSSNLAYKLSFANSCLLGLSSTRTACFKDYNFVMLDADFSANDPSFEAQIIDIDNEIQARWTIKRSDLE